MKFNKIFSFILVFVLAFFLVSCKKKTSSSKATITLNNSSYNLVIGETLDLEANIKEATGNKQDLKSSVIISHTIPMEDGKVTEAGDYTVKYSLTVSDVEYTAMCAVIVNDFDPESYHPFVSKKEFTNEGFVMRVLNVNLTNDDLNYLVIDAVFDDYKDAKVSKMTVDKDGNLDIVIALNANWDGEQHTYDITLNYHGYDILTIDKSVQYNPELELKSLALQINLGDKVIDKLKENIVSAKLTDGTNALDKVTLDYFIPSDNNGNATQEGSYVVDYELKEGKVVKNYSISVDVIDFNKSTQLPTITDCEFNSYGLEGYYLMFFDNNALNNKLTSLTGLSLDEVAQNVEFKYVLFNNDTKEVIHEINCPVSLYYDCYPLCDNVRPLIEKYISDNSLSTLTIGATVQLVRKSSCSIAVRNGEVSTISVPLTVKGKASEVEAFSIPAPFGQVVIGTPSNFYVNFAYPYLIDSVTDGLNKSLGELYSQLVFEYVVYNTSNNETIKVIQKPFEKNNNILVYSDEIRDDLDTYMNEKKINILTFAMTVQLKKSSTYNLKTNLTESPKVAFQSMTIDMSNVVEGNCLVYNELLGVLEEVSVQTGQACVWYDLGKDSTSLTANIDPTTGEIIFVGYQPASGTWWQTQFFATFNPVSVAGTYKQQLVFTSTTEGVITINGTAHDIHVGENVVNLLFDLAAGQSAHISMQFGSTKTGKSFPSFVIKMKGLTQQSTLQVKSENLTAKVGDNLNDVLANNIYLAFDEFGQKANDKVEFVSIIVTEDGAITEAGTYSVTYKLVVNGEELTKTVNLSVTE